MLAIPRFEVDQTTQEDAVHVFEQLGTALPMMQIVVPEVAELNKYITTTGKNGSTKDTAADGFNDLFYSVADSVLEFMELKGQLLDEDMRLSADNESLLTIIPSEFYINDKPDLYLQHRSSITKRKSNADSRPHVDTAGTSKLDLIYALHVNIRGEGLVRAGSVSPRRTKLTGRKSELSHEGILGPNVISIFARRGVERPAIKKNLLRLKPGAPREPRASLHEFVTSPNDRRLFADVAFVVNPQAVSPEGRIL